MKHENKSKNYDCRTELVCNAKFFCRAHDAVIRVYNAAGNLIESHEHKGDFKE